MEWLNLQYGVRSENVVNDKMMRVHVRVRTCTYTCVRSCVRVCVHGGMQYNKNMFYKVNRLMSST